MKIRIIIAPIVFLLTIFYEGTTQTNELKFNLVEGPNGKPLGKIRNITQDPHGYMWFSGEEEKCVYRYDGNKIITFKHDDANTNSLGGAFVNVVHADDKGMIWIGMNTGLDQFNPATGIFKHYKYVPNDPGSLKVGIITSIIKDRLGRLWVGGNDGLDRLDEKTGKFIHYRNQPANNKSLSSNYVWCIYEDRQGMIWIGTGFPWSDKDFEDGGLNRLEVDGTFTRFMNDPNNSTSIINNKIATILEDSRGIFWVGTSGNGLHTMDRKTGTFERHLYDPKNPYQLSRPRLNIAGRFFDKINFITEDSTGAIWIGTEQSGINRYDPVTKKITYLMNGNGFPDSSGWNAFTSRDGEVWITTESAKLYRVDPFRKSIYSIPTGNLATSFHEDKEGDLWVSTTGNGLLKFDQDKNLVKQFKHDPLDSFSLLDNNTGMMFQYQENALLVSSYNGIRVFNKLTNQFSRFQVTEAFKDSIDVGFSNILRDDQGIMWFCRWGLGLIRYNPKDNSTKQFLFNPEDSTSIGSNSINNILEDGSGTLWVAGLGGINSLNRETYKFKRYLAGTFITYLYKDSRDNLWAGTDKGLYRYDRKEDRFTSFFDRQAEVNFFTVGGIIEDDAKNLWLTSPSAIIKLNPATKETFVYGNSFGINPNSLAAYTRTYRNPKGQLFIGHQNGFYTFFPEELAVKPDFKILITDLFINTLPVLPGKESPLQIPVEEFTDLDLKYNQNNIAFTFAAIDYRQPEAIKYFTMLEGYDNTWREAKEEKSSYYFNLSRGKYVYRVIAFNSDGTKAEKIITVFINPPWWQTWWFRTLVGIFLLASFYAFYRWRTASLRRQKRKLERTVKERTAEVLEEKAVVERQKDVIEKEKEKSDELLLNILPYEVAEELKVKGYTTAKSFDEVTVLFSDIKGFTNVAEKMTAQELVKEIDTYFSSFDRIMQQYGLEKIKTIGDAYIAAGGLPEKNSATAQNVIEAAVAMQQEVEKLKQERIASNKPYFELRIGIHTGPVVAGVVGIKKFQYDIWGDTVNLAARMEQSGVPGKINISQHTYEAVKDQFNCVHRGKIEAKNKGEIDMYFVE